MLFENGATRAVGAMNIESAAVGGVHGDATGVCDISQGEYVGDGVGIVPDRAKGREHTFLARCLMTATVCFQMEDFVDVVNVGE